MAYKLPYPKFKVQNLLNRTKTYGTARKLTWKAVNKAFKYNIYSMESHLILQAGLMVSISRVPKVLLF